MSKKAIADNEYIVSVWFERDRANISLSLPDGKVIFELWDEDVDEAITDGFLVPPRLASMSSAAANDSEAWRSTVLDYARYYEMID